MSLEKNRLMLLAGLLTEQAAGSGTSNSFKSPGHTAKVNQAQKIEKYVTEQSQEDLFKWLETGKLYKVDMYDVRNELIDLAYQIVGRMHELHIPQDSDRKTEKMTKQKFAKILLHLKKLKNLTE